MKWSICSALLLLVSLACADLIPIPTQQSEFPVGASGNGTIWYQYDPSNGNPKGITFGNVLNPINVSIVYNIGSINYPAQVCLNSFEFRFPISGANIEAACPAGALGQASNASTLALSKQFSNAAVDETTTEDYTTQTVTAQLYVKPTTSGGLLVTIPDSVDVQSFQLSWFGSQCSSADTYPLGPNNECISLPELKSSTGTLEPETSTYFLYTVTDDVNSISVTTSGINDGLEVFVQRDYYPTREWFLKTIDLIDDDEGTITNTILSPTKGEQYFFMFYNSDKKDSLEYNITVSVPEICSTGTQFGYNCTHDSTDPNSPLDSYLRLSATIGVNSTTGVSANNGTGWSFDYYDDDESYPNEYAYFSLADYPTHLGIGTPYFVRVTVGNNDASALAGAPGIFAKKGGYPSAQSNHYNMSTTGDVAHQILIPIYADDIADQMATPGILPVSETWFFAVQLPADFTIWVGVNCANNCSSEEHGVCYCNTQTCDSQSSDVFYQRPSSVLDSAGACTCDDDQYVMSFDCSSKGNSHSVMYLLLIALGGAVILCIAIGVPLYCFIANRRANHERV